MEITPTNRTRYREYLQSSAWRARRNRALRAARYQCAGCGSKRGLEVHHRSYERLGAEWDEDLDVLCRDCHEGHHIQAMHDSDQHRVYLKLASTVLEAHRFSSVAELAAEVKAQCIALKMPYDNHQIDRALEFVTGTDRLAPILPQTREAVVAEQGRGLTHAEARECLRRWEFDGLLKTMPTTVSKIDIYGPVPREDEAYDYDRY